MDGWMDACMDAWMHKCIHIYIYVHVYAYICMYMHVYACAWCWRHYPICILHSHLITINDNLSRVGSERTNIILGWNSFNTTHVLPCFVRPPVTSSCQLSKRPSEVSKCLFQLIGIVLPKFLNLLNLAIDSQGYTDETEAGSQRSSCQWLTRVTNHTMSWLRNAIRCHQFESVMLSCL